MVDNKKTNNIATTLTVVAREQITDKISDEIRFHASGGTGFAAEQANNLYDNLTLHPAKIVGDNNEKMELIVRLVLKELQEIWGVMLLA